MLNSEWKNILDESLFSNNEHQVSRYLILILKYIIKLYTDQANIKFI